jgi:hypothetical protein
VSDVEKRRNVNPEVEEIRAALWTVFWDAKEGHLEDETAYTLGELLRTLAQLAEVEAYERQELERGG